MAPSLPILSLCHRCLIRRIFLTQSPLLRRLIPASSAGSYRALSGSRYYGTSESYMPLGAAEPGTSTSEFQKDYKKAMKERNKEKHKPEEKKERGQSSPKWQVTVGLEIHAQLNTERKLFSDARTSHIASPNTHISPFDASLPGTQPIFNPSVLLPALRASLALNCTPARESRFDRKHYFYWDQPAGYQITQFYAPLASDGWLVLSEQDGLTPLEGSDGTEESGVRVGIQQIQLEQDTGKTIVSPPNSLVDLNRVGSPLIEIITEPFDCPNTVFPSMVMKKIQANLKAVDACVLGMEWGGLRADVNVSVRLSDGPSVLGQRCEIKNVSSIKAIQEAVEAESKRQIEILEAGGVIEGETRGWDAEKGVTRRLRGKEGEVDYRFMPDPDLPPIFVSKELVAGVKQFLPLLPDKILEQLVSPPYELQLKDAKTLLLWDESRASSTETGVMDYYKEIVQNVQDNLLVDQPLEDVEKVAGAKGDLEKKSKKQARAKELLEIRIKKLADKKGLVLPESVGRAVGNWVIHELGGQLTTNNLSWKENPMDPVRMADLVTYVINKRITGPTAKNLLTTLLSTTPIDPRPIPQIIKDSNLEVVFVSDDEIFSLAKKIIFADQNSIDILEQLRDPEGLKTGKQLNGKRRKGLFNWFVGRTMRESGGRVPVDKVEEAVASVVEGKDE